MFREDRAENVGPRKKERRKSHSFSLSSKIVPLRFLARFSTEKEKPEMLDALQV